MLPLAPFSAAAVSCALSSWAWFSGDGVLVSGGGVSFSASGALGLSSGGFGLSKSSAKSSIGHLVGSTAVRIWIMIICTY